MLQGVGLKKYFPATRGLAVGRPPGLLTAPTGALWVAQRLAWLPAFAAALAVLWMVFHPAERRLVRPRRAHGWAVLLAWLVPRHDRG